MTIPESVCAVLERLECAGYAAYLVGGCVRDKLLGRTPLDWDVCTSARPEETERVFSDCRVIETGMKHGTVTVLWDGVPFEITTFRSDGAYTDGRHPDSVEYTDDLTEDLARRDFTINAMAMDRRGELCDPFGGQADLASRILRCVGEPERRFREDALRLLRALRFAARYALRAEPETASALYRCRELIGCVSLERIFSELCGIVTAPGAEAVLREYPDVLFAAVPELAPLRGLAQNPHTHRHNAWEHTLRTLGATPEDTVLRLAALLHDMAKPEVRMETADGPLFPHHSLRGGELADALLTRLRCDNATRRAVVSLVSVHGKRPPKTLPEARYELAYFGEERLEQLNLLRRADAIGHDSPRGEERLRELERGCALTAEALREGFPLTLKELAVNGNDLRALGITGKAAGETLRALHRAVLDGKAPNERAALLAAAEAPDALQSLRHEKEK